MRRWRLLPDAVQRKLQSLQPDWSHRRVQRRVCRDDAGPRAPRLLRSTPKQLRTEWRVRRERTVRSLDQRRVQDGELRRSLQSGNRGFRMQRARPLRHPRPDHMCPVSLRPDRVRLLSHVHGDPAVLGSQSLCRQLVRAQSERRRLLYYGRLLVRQLCRRALLRYGVLRPMPGLRSDGFSRDVLSRHPGAAARYA
jgi:hypothetical protein